MMTEDDLRVMSLVAIINKQIIGKRIFSVTVTIIDSSLIVQGVPELPDFPDSQVQRTDAGVELIADASVLVAKNPAKIVRRWCGEGGVRFQIGVLVVAPVVVRAE